MKVCAEFEEQVSAFNAHKGLIDKGADPEDIELRSPYPLSERPIPAHRSKPMVMRNVVRIMWLVGLIGGFSFLTYTQLEWGLTAKTGGQPLVAIPINSIIMYECGMITAILVTTLMFFVETRRYRQLVPPIEEDMPVAIGYIALVVSGESAKKAKEWLEDSGARNIVTYMLPLMCLGLLSSGCATGNMRYQQTIKPLERAADLPAPQSVAMPNRAQQEVIPPQPYGWLTLGDQKAFDIADKQLSDKTKAIDEAVKAGTKQRKDANKEARALKKEYKSLFEVIEPEISSRKSNAVPAELKDFKSPVEANQASLDNGKILYDRNCAQCHGATGGGDGKVGEVWAPAPPAIGSAEYADKYSDGGFYHFIMTGKNNMPAFGYKMTTKEIFDVVNYLRKLQGKV